MLTVANIVTVNDVRPEWEGFHMEIREDSDGTFHLVACGPRGGKYPDSSGITTDKDGIRNLIKSLVELL